ncbi:hypothetical protein K438DRAFT_1975837 [Mycena galopus ATCC 62051]|nr:hypothetical protein K438DRAFT_1975837 [Mycena galopus ATCC 62051]
MSGSLFEELTTLTGPRYPVTKLLRELLETVARDACQTQRNVHSMCFVVSRARDVCAQINSLANTAGSSASWDAFTRYTEMIISLEGILLDFELLSRAEAEAEILPTAKTVKENIQFIDDWKKNRVELRGVVKLMQETFQNGSPSEAEIKAAYRHDDASLLMHVSESLTDFIELLDSKGSTDPTTSLSHLAKTSIRNIQQLLDGIRAAVVISPDNLSEDVVAYAIQTSMAIEFVATARDNQISPRRESADMWARATSLIKLVETHCKNADLSVDPLKDEWDGFLTCLLAEVPKTTRLAEGTGTPDAKDSSTPQTGAGETGARDGQDSGAQDSGVAQTGAGEIDARDDQDSGTEQTGAGDNQDSGGQDSGTGAGETGADDGQDSGAHDSGTGAEDSGTGTGETGADDGQDSGAHDSGTGAEDSGTGTGETGAGDNQDSGAHDSGTAHTGAGDGQDSVAQDSGTDAGETGAGDAQDPSARDSDATQTEAGETGERDDQDSGTAQTGSGQTGAPDTQDSGTTHTGAGETGTADAQGIETTQTETAGTGEASTEASSESGLSLPPEYFELRTLALQILRPYYGQSLALIASCFELGTSFSTTQTVEKLSPLQTALRDTTTALKAAADITYDPGVPFQSQELSSAFTAARASIKQCFEDYETQSAEFERNLDKAAALDAARMRQIQAFTTARKSDDTPRQQPIELSVLISGAGAPETKTYSVEPSMTLNAVLWKVSMESNFKEQANTLRTQGYFAAENKRLSLSTRVGRFSGQGGNQSVSLIIPV